MIPKPILALALATFCLLPMRSNATAEVHPIQSMLEKIPAAKIDPNAMKKELKEFFDANPDFLKRFKLVRDGGHSGGGGTLAPDRFTTTVEVLVARLKEVQALGVNLRVHLNIAELEDAIRTTRVVSTTAELLNAFGKPVDAMNFPHSKLIILKEDSWSKYLESTHPTAVRRVAETILHEYYGIMSKGDPKSRYFENGDKKNSANVIGLVPAYIDSCEHLEDLSAQSIRQGVVRLSGYIEALLNARDRLQELKFCGPLKIR